MGRPPQIGRMGAMDVAVDLVEVFLRFNGYLTLSEWQIQAVNKRGDWETLTDVDILGVRFPGPVLLADTHDPDEATHLTVPGIPLFLEEDTVDVIIGEVKEGEAVFNPALTRHETLHTILHRLQWLYQEGDLERVVEDLHEKGACYTPARGNGTIRTRLVAFGRAPEANLNVVPIGVILESVGAVLEMHDDLFRSARFANPAAATLKLLHKAGFTFSRGSSDAPDSP